MHACMCTELPDVYLWLAHAHATCVHALNLRLASATFNHSLTGSVCGSAIARIILSLAFKDNHCLQHVWYLCAHTQHVRHSCLGHQPAWCLGELS